MIICTNKCCLKYCKEIMSGCRNAQNYCYNDIVKNCHARIEYMILEKSLEKIIVLNHDLNELKKENHRLKNIIKTISSK